MRKTGNFSNAGKRCRRKDSLTEKSDKFKLFSQKKLNFEYFEFRV